MLKSFAMIPILHQPFGFIVAKRLPGNPIPVQLLQHLTPANDEGVKYDTTNRKNSGPKIRIV